MSDVTEKSENDGIEEEELKTSDKEIHDSNDVNADREDESKSKDKPSIKDILKAEAEATTESEADDDEISEESDNNSNAEENNGEDSDDHDDVGEDEEKDKEPPPKKEKSRKLKLPKLNKPVTLGLAFSGIFIISIIVGILFMREPEPEVPISAVIEVPEEKETETQKPVLIDDYEKNEQETESSELVPEEKEEIKIFIAKEPKKEEKKPIQTVKEIRTKTPLTFFNNKEYNKAAQAWKSEKKQTPSRYTIALVFACQAKTLQDANNALTEKDDFFVLPYISNKRECFFACWGDFLNLSEANKQLSEVPDWFKNNGASPKVKTFSELLK